MNFYKKARVLPYKHIKQSLTYMLYFAYQPLKLSLVLEKEMDNILIESFFFAFVFVSKPNLLRFLTEFDNLFCLVYFNFTSVFVEKF